MFRARQLRFLNASLVTASVGAITVYQCRKENAGGLCLPYNPTECAAPQLPQVSTATYNANDPIEDRFVVKNVCLTKSWWAGANKDDTWNFSAIFDGHGGWQVAEMASRRLLPELIEQLTSEKNKGATLEKDVVESSLLTTFKQVEQEYLDKVRDSYRLGFGEVAKVGACALVAVQHKADLYLANCGDCRAVLGSDLATKTAAAATDIKKKEGEEGEGDNNGATKSLHVASRITSDHNARMPLELLKLQKEHPGEADVVVCKNPHACYVKGRLQLTRALGDAYLKYAEFNAPPGSHRSRGRHIPDPFTPPYVKSTPDVHHLRVGAGDRFCVMATDGLWDFLSDQEAVDVVSRAISDGVPAAAADRLVTAALTKAAEECGMEYGALMRLPAGRQRRGRHDDTTVVVLYLDQ